MNIDLLSDLETALRSIGRPLRVYYLGSEKAWIADIQWITPDHSDHCATGRGDNLRDAVLACMKDYRQKNGGGFRMGSGIVVPAPRGSVRPRPGKYFKCPDGTQIQGYDGDDGYYEHELLPDGTSRWLSY